jgi:hypothetical protein
MAKLPKDFDFVTDPTLDPDLKKILLAGVIEERRHKRETALKARDAQSTQTLEQKRFWHNTPLMLALVGTITVFANGLVSYVLAGRTTSDTLTTKQLDAQLKESENRSQADRERQFTEFKQQLSQQTSDADARRLATKDERDFAFKVVQEGITKGTDLYAQVQQLLLLAQAGLVNTLDGDGLEKLLRAQCEKAAKGCTDVAIKETVVRARFAPFDFPEVSLDKINFEKVIMIANASPDGRAPYTEIRQDHDAFYVRETAEVVLRRLAGGASFVTLTRPNGTAIWVKSSIITVVQTPPDGVYVQNTNAELRIGAGRQGVKEDAGTVAARLKPPLVKLTSVNGKPLWVNGALTKTFGGSKGVKLDVDGVTIDIKEELSTARALLNGTSGER